MFHTNTLRAQPVCRPVRLCSRPTKTPQTQKLAGPPSGASPAQVSLQSQLLRQEGAPLAAAHQLAVDSSNLSHQRLCLLGRLQDRQQTRRATHKQARLVLSDGHARVLANSFGGVEGWHWCWCWCPGLLAQHSSLVVLQPPAFTDSRAAACAGGFSQHAPRQDVNSRAGCSMVQLTTDDTQEQQQQQHQQPLNDQVTLTSVLKTASARKLPAGTCTMLPQLPFSAASMAARAAAAASPSCTPSPSPPPPVAAAAPSPSAFCFFFSLRSCRLLRPVPCGWPGSTRECQLPKKTAVHGGF